MYDFISKFKILLTLENSLHLSSITIQNKLTSARDKVLTANSHSICSTVTRWLSLSVVPAQLITLDNSALATCSHHPEHHILSARRICWNKFPLKVQSFYALSMCWWDESSTSRLHAARVTLENECCATSWAQQFTESSGKNYFRVSVDVCWTFSPQHRTHIRNCCGTGWN